MVIPTICIYIQEYIHGLLLRETFPGAKEIGEMQWGGVPLLTLTEQCRTGGQSPNGKTPFEECVFGGLRALPRTRNNLAGALMLCRIHHILYVQVHPSAAMTNGQVATMRLAASASRNPGAMRQRFNIRFDYGVQ